MNKKNETLLKFNLHVLYMQMQTLHTYLIYTAYIQFIIIVSNS